MITLTFFVASILALFFLVRLTYLPGLPITLGFFARIILSLLVYFNIVTPPSTQDDAVTFMKRVDEWSHLDWASIAQKMIPNHSYVHAAVGASIYKIFGEQPLFLIFINVFLGTILVALTYYLSKILIGEKRAKTVIWIAALFPPTVIYSSVFLREVWGIVPFMLGLLCTVAWQQKGKAKDLLCSVVFFILASFFHGAYVVALLVLFILSAKEILKPFFSLNPLVRNQQFLTSLFAVIILSMIFVNAVATNVRLGSIGNVSEHLGDPTTVIEGRLTRETRGGSAFPNIAGGEDFGKRTWLFPVRLAYFLFSPFPWDIRSIGNLQGLVATGVFSYIAISIYKSRNIFCERKEVMAVAMITSAMIIIFTIGTDNIGTSIRHRSKFLFALLALCASPVFKPMVWDKNRYHTLKVTKRK